MLDKGDIKEVVELKPESFRTKRQLKKLNWEYWNHPVKRTITENTLFIYPDKTIAGLFLKKVVSAEVQKSAYDAFMDMEWELPQTRPETVAAIKRQKPPLVPAGELLVGFNTVRRIEYSGKTLRKHFRHLEPLVRRLDEVFKYTLPQEWEYQNKLLPVKERKRQAKTKDPRYGGLPYRFRLFLTSFSNITMLKSCPAACHQDANGKKSLQNFSCFTSVGKGFSGGRFCLIEYGIEIPVMPGSILICQSTKEWHCNLGAVQGTKFSVVCYYKNILPSAGLSKERLSIGPSVPEETAGHRMLDRVRSMTEKEKNDLLMRGLKRLKEKHRGK
jgi:hypothetical protein